jgi:ribose-phosphate pyrophosphokinase
MKVLNLTNLEQSEIKYNIQRFPDGQQNIVILNTEEFKEKTAPSGFNGVRRILPSTIIQIKTRLNNFKDLELIVAATASLRELGVKKIHLYCPYFIGARSDRKFEEGGNWYLKQVICPIINKLKFKSVTVLDAHSWVLGNLLNNFKGIDNEQFVRFAIYDLCKLNEKCESKVNEFILVSPDTGASHKIYKLAEKIGYKGDIITCSKERDTEGNLTKTNVPITGEQHIMLHTGPYKDFIIIDDICDGGRTFINIAKEIKEYFHESGKTESKIYLIVTHGIFSAGFEELSKYFDGIYCTNSYSNIGDYAGNNLQKTLVSQLNVF